MFNRSSRTDCSKQPEEPDSFDVSPQCWFNFVCQIRLVFYIDDDDGHSSAACLHFSRRIEINCSSEKLFFLSLVLQLDLTKCSTLLDPSKESLSNTIRHQEFIELSNPNQWRVTYFTYSNHLSTHTFTLAQ